MLTDSFLPRAYFSYYGTLATFVISHQRKIVRCILTWTRVILAILLESSWLLLSGLQTLTKTSLEMKHLKCKSLVLGFFLLSSILSVVHP